MADQKSFNVSGYLTITGRKTYGGYSGRIVKVTSNKPALSNNEICIAINVKVPNAFFERLTPVINIELPQEAVVNPDVQTVIDLSAIEIADKLKLDVTEVSDMLSQMLEAKKTAGESLTNS